MADPIDPRLYASSLPPRAQAYTAAPPHNAGQPYYLPSASQHQTPPLSQPAPLPNTLDPALEQATPTGHESHDEDEQDDEGEHDGYVMPPANILRTSWIELAMNADARTQDTRDARVGQVSWRLQAPPGMRFVSRAEGVCMRLRDAWPQLTAYRFAATRNGQTSHVDAAQRPAARGV